MAWYSSLVVKNGTSSIEETEMTAYQEKIVKQMSRYHQVFVAETENNNVTIISHNRRSKKDLHYHMDWKGRVKLIRIAPTENKMRVNPHAPY